MSGRPMDILLTGAASGLGRGLALHFASRGHRLVLADINAGGPRETVGLLGAAAEWATAHELDVGSARQVRELFASLGGRPIELLVNDAGALDEELARLPERLQAPLVLCYLEGKTRDEAARELGWTVGQLRGRLERGRDLLRSRLTRRGLALSAALLGAALTHDASAALPATLIGAAVKVAAGAVPAQVAALAGGVLRTMFVAKVKTVALLLFAVMAMGTAGVILHQVARAQPAPVDSRAEVPVGEPPVAKPEPEAVRPAPAPAADDFGAEVKELRAKVTLAKAKFALGEAIEVKYVLKNISKEE
jgi:NAD(P)-dependent dehydrogenase (short-subunit alcohol dehydrogenase family)